MLQGGHTGHNLLGTHVLFHGGLGFLLQPRLLGLLLGLADELLDEPPRDDREEQGGCRWRGGPVLLPDLFAGAEAGLWGQRGDTSPAQPAPWGQQQQEHVGAAEPSTRPHSARAGAVHVASEPLRLAQGGKCWEENSLVQLQPGHPGGAAGGQGAAESMGTLRALLAPTPAPRSTGPPQPLAFCHAPTQQRPAPNPVGSPKTQPCREPAAAGELLRMENSGCEVPRAGSSVSAATCRAGGRGRGASPPAGPHQHFPSAPRARGARRWPWWQRDRTEPYGEPGEREERVSEGGCQPGPGLGRGDPPGTSPAPVGTGTGAWSRPWGVRVVLQPRGALGHVRPPPFPAWSGARGCREEVTRVAVAPGWCRVQPCPAEG